MSRLPKYFLIFLISGITSAKETNTGIESLPEEAREQIQQDAANMATEWLPTLRTLTSHTQEKITLNAFIQKLMPHGFAKVGGLSARDAEDPPDRWDIRRRENAAKYDRKFINALQLHSDDYLTYQSFAKTIESLLAIWPNKLLPLDVDGDGKITLAEYAASAPLVQDQDTDEDGFSKDQRRRFAYYDDNKNGVIDGAEILSSTSYYHKTMRHYMSTILIARADLNQDSTLSQTELAKLIPQAKKLPKSVPLSEALFWLRDLDSDDLTSVRDQLLGQTTVSFQQKKMKSDDGKSLAYELGTLVVPEVRGDSKSRMIKIGFARFKAKNNATAPPIFYLPGGPGNSYLMSFNRSDVDDLNRRFDLSGMREFSDVIFVDQRGYTEQGDILRATFETPTMPAGSLIDRPSHLDAFRKFAQSATKEFAEKGINLAGYTVKECAYDVADLRQALGYEKITLVGTSFGSQWSFAVMKLFPDIVERALLSGVEPLDFSLDKPSDVFSAILRMWQKVDADPAFKPYLPPGGMAEAARTVITRLEAKPMPVIRKSADGKEEIICLIGPKSFPLYDPADILELYHQQPDPTRWDRVRKSRGGKDSYRLILPLIDSSLGVTPERKYQLWNDPAVRYLGRRNFERLITSTDDWPSPNMGDAFRRAQACPIPVVFAQGDWDTSTPIENTYHIAPFFTNSHTIIAHQGGHGVLSPISHQHQKTWQKILTFLRSGELENLPSRVTLDPSKKFRFPKVDLNEVDHN